MENLIPLEDYLQDPTGYWRRAPVVVGTIFVACGAIGIAVTLLVTGVWLTASDLARLAALTLGLGVVSGLGFARNVRRRLDHLVRLVYASEGRFATEPPAAGEYQYRLPCSWKKSSPMAVGGVMFIGSGGVAFVPHAGNFKRDRKAFSIGPADSVRWSVREAKVGRVAGWFTPWPSEILTAAVGSQEWAFLVPRPRRVREMVERILADA